MCLCNEWQRRASLLKGFGLWGSAGLGIGSVRAFGPGESQGRGGPRSQMCWVHSGARCVVSGLIQMWWVKPKARCAVSALSQMCCQPWARCAVSFLSLDVLGHPRARCAMSSQSQMSCLGPGPDVLVCPVPDVPCHSWTQMCSASPKPNVLSQLQSSYAV